MGVYRKIKRLLKARTNQADTLDAMSVPELFNEAKEALWEIEAQNRDLDLTQPVLAIDKLLKQQQAKWELSQRNVADRKLSKTSKNATTKPHHHKEG